MKSFREVKKQLLEMIEDRRPAVDYEHRNERDKVVSAEEKDKIKKVVAILKGGNQSKASLALAHTFLETQTEHEKLEKQLEDMKEKIRTEIVERFFDAADEVYTRVIDAGDMIIQLNKKTVVAGKDKVDFEKFYIELLKLLPHMTTALEELKKAATTPGKDSVRASTVTVKKVEEAFDLASLKRVFEAIVKKLLFLYDNGINKLKRQYGLATVKKEDVMTTKDSNPELMVKETKK